MGGQGEERMTSCHYKLGIIFSSCMLIQTEQIVHTHFI